jgi:hypothetical protein
LRQMSYIDWHPEIEKKVNKERQKKDLEKILFILHYLTP